MTVLKALSLAGKQDGGMDLNLSFGGSGININFLLGTSLAKMARQLRDAASEMERWDRVTSPPESPVPWTSPPGAIPLPVPTPSPEGPTKAQQKAAWGFVAGALRLAQANTRSGFDARMLDAAIVICQANERSL